MSGQRAETSWNVGALSLLMRRLVAGSVDMIILAGINAAIVYFTLRLASLPVAETSELPAGPLLAFLALFDVGYLVVLTAFGGQTIGRWPSASASNVEEASPFPCSKRSCERQPTRCPCFPWGLAFL